MTTPRSPEPPADEGVARHLVGMLLPELALPATDGDMVDLSRLPGRHVVYCYLRTSRPDQPAPPDWDSIPGARGCTPQSCAFRDHHAELRVLGAGVFGLSTQDTAYQREAVDRLHLPFPLLSDQLLEFATALALPTFAVEIEGAPVTLLTRLTMIISEGRIDHVNYPVFPPDADAANVIDWLRQHPRQTTTP